MVVAASFCFFSRLLINFHSSSRPKCRRLGYSCLFVFCFFVSLFCTILILFFYVLAYLSVEIKLFPYFVNAQPHQFVVIRNCSLKIFYAVMLLLCSLKIFYAVIFSSSIYIQVHWCMLYVIHCIKFCRQCCLIFFLCFSHLVDYLYFS